MPASRLTFAIAAAVVSTVAQPTWAAEGIRPIRIDETTKSAAAVVVDGSRHLAYTSLILPLDEQARDVAVDDVERQTKAVLDHLDRALKPAGSGLDRLVRVNVHLARPDALPGFQAVFARRMAAVGGRPAVGFVTTALPRKNVLLGIDAVAVADHEPSKPGAVDRFNFIDLTVQRLGNHVAILPAGARMFISGQAEPSADLAEATRKTLKSLDATLKHYGLNKSQVVQAKAFLQPIERVGEAEAEFLDYFGAADVPPLTFVDWKSSPQQPIEIELVVAAGPRGASGPIEYLGAPGLEQSPVYSRVVRIGGGDLIYTAGLYGAARAAGQGEVESIFDQLGAILKESGSDLRNLVKATYYVADEESSGALNRIRPSLYDPKRPPAASKALVIGVGRSDRSVTLDMIAAPARAGN